MGKSMLRILKQVPIYSKHQLSANKVGELLPSQLVSFNREKKRNGTNWMEIYIDNKTAYLKKERGVFYECQYVELDDEIVTGFNFEKKPKAPLLPMISLFFPLGRLNSLKDNVGKIKVESIESVKDNKSMSIALEYSKDLIIVEEINLVKGEKFYITNETFNKKEVFKEIDNLKGKKGFILKKTNCSTLGDKWMLNLSIAITILTVGGIFLGFLANGWIVISGLMVIAGLVVGVVFMFVLNILLMILKGVFNQVRKRF